MCGKADPSNTPSLDDATVKRGFGREQRLKKTVFISVAAKAVRFGSQLLIVGLATRYMGPERYGLWMVVMAALSWLSWGQIGIGPGLVNAIAEADGKKDEKSAGEHFTSALYAITAFGLIAFIVISVALPWVDWATLLGVVSPSLKAEIPMLVLVSATLLLLRFPMSIFEVGYNAYQIGYMARWWEMLGQLMSVAAVFLLIQAGASLAWVVFGVQGAAELAILGGGLFLVLKLKPHLMPKLSRFKLRSCGRVLHTGAAFFLIQIASYLVMQSGLLLLSHHHGPAAVTPYSITWQLCQMGSGVWMMFAVNLWAAFGEARASGDWRWIERTKKRLVKWTMLYSIAFSIGLAFFGQPMIRLWAGDGAVPDQTTLHLLSIYSILFSWTVVHAMILNGLNVVWKQTIGALLNGILALAFSMLLVPIYATTGLVLSLIGANILSNSWITFFLLRKELELHVH